MPYNPTGAALLALYAGIAPSNSFLALQTNQAGQLEAYLVGVTGSPQSLFTVTPSSGNYNLGLITGSNSTFSFNNGTTFIQSPIFANSGAQNTGGLLNVSYGTERAGVNIYGSNSNFPSLRLRKSTEYPAYFDYKITLGDNFITEDIFSQEVIQPLPGNMMTFCANAFNSSSWGTSIAGASSSSSPTYNSGQVIGTAFCTWNGVGIAKRNFAIFPEYIEMGGSTTDYPYEDIGEGSVVLRNSPNIGSGPHSDGLSFCSYLSVDGKSHLSFTNMDSSISELIPGIKNTDCVTYSTGAYNAVTASRSLTNNDNGKTLYLDNGNYLLTFVNSLVKPFNCKIISEGTGVSRVTGDGTATIRNFQGKYRTAGQYSVCYLDCRAGSNNVIMWGDVQT